MVQSGQTLRSRQIAVATLGVLTMASLLAHLVLVAQKTPFDEIPTLTARETVTVPQIEAVSLLKEKETVTSKQKETVTLTQSETVTLTLTETTRKPSCAPFIWNPSSVEQRQVFSGKFSAFSPVMNVSDISLSLDLLSVFVDILDKLGVTYFIFYGSLIGSYRHHGFIPWDDDIDIAFNVSQSDVMFDALASAAPEFALGNLNFPKFYRFNPGAKTFRATELDETYLTSENSFSDVVQWPYIDIFHFEDSGSEICVIFDSRRCWPRESILPLQRRPFECMMLPVPRNLSHVFELMGPCYSDIMDDCWSSPFNHRKEKMNRKIINAPCQHFMNVLPFVKRQVLEHSVVETLMLGNKTLHSLNIPLP